MDSIKASFIRLALECKALRFGQFTLKSGRTSPYFFNAGHFSNGNALKALGQAYAETLLRQNLPIEHLFGLAYKGLPLATATALALAEKGIDVALTFNRKEIKDHGEGGLLMGAPLSGNIIIVDDVITAGTAFREAQAIVKHEGASLVGLIIALDRCERGKGARSTLEEIESEGVKVTSIITFFDLVDYLRQNGNTKEVDSLLAYHDQHA
ncbi:MAG: orotate phosphoribosyltransferase [Legionella sp.]|nr:orotate phosphoribosyltransferase [Legionella sp.]